MAYQIPLSMGFSRQEYWSGLPFPPPGDLPDPGIKSNKQDSPMTQKLKLSVQFSRSVVSDSLHWKLKELLGWPKRSFSFLSKNKRHIFHFHQELSFLFFFFFFTKNFTQQCIPCFVPLPSAIFFRQLHKSIFPKLCIFLSKQLFQVPYTIFQGIESFSINF